MIFLKRKTSKIIAMFTVNIKGKRDSKNIEFVKLEMIFY